MNFFSFQELREVRVAFQLYESEDMLGLLIDERILMRTLKVIISHSALHVLTQILIEHSLKIIHTSAILSKNKIEQGSLEGEIIFHYKLY